MITCVPSPNSLRDELREKGSAENIDCIHCSFSHFHTHENKRTVIKIMMFCFMNDLIVPTVFIAPQNLCTSSPRVMIDTPIYISICVYLCSLVWMCTLKWVEAYNYTSWSWDHREFLRILWTFISGIFLGMQFLILNCGLFM